MIFNLMDQPLKRTIARKRVELTSAPATVEWKGSIFSLSGLAGDDDASREAFYREVHAFKLPDDVPDA